MTFYPDTAGAVSFLCVCSNLESEGADTAHEWLRVLFTVAADLAEWQRPAQPSEDGSFQKLGLCPIYF